MAKVIGVAGERAYVSNLHKTYCGYRCTVQGPPLLIGGVFYIPVLIDGKPPDDPRLIQHGMLYLEQETATEPNPAPGERVRGKNNRSFHGRKGTVVQRPFEHGQEWWVVVAFDDDPKWLNLVQLKYLEPPS